MNMPKQWLHLGNDIIDSEHFHPIKNEPLFPKPIGGLWASPLQLGSEHYSEWEKYSTHIWGSTKNQKAVIFQLKKNARVYVIDNQQDLIQLIEEVGSVKVPFYFKLNVTIDFEKTKELYDVIYLTKKGQSATRLPLINREYNLYGWDCESAVILNLDAIGKSLPVSI